MHHRHGDFGRRLSEAERLEIRRLVRSGEPYRVAAAAVGRREDQLALIVPQITSPAMWILCGGVVVPDATTSMKSASTCAPAAEIDSTPALSMV